MGDSLCSLPINVSYVFFLFVSVTLSSLSAASPRHPEGSIFDVLLRLFVPHLSDLIENNIIKDQFIVFNPL